MSASQPGFSDPAREAGGQACTPVAGCAPAGRGARDGAAYHCRWLVVDEQGRWLTAQDCPPLAGLDTELRLGYLVLRAPGMLRLDIPLDVIEDDDSVRRTAFVGGRPVDAVDEGDLAAAWLGNLLQRPGRLYKVHPDAPPVDWAA